MLHALVCVYNSVETITECLESFEGKVDRIKILDVSWIGFPSSSLHSNDGTLEAIRKFQETSKTKTILILPDKHLHQIEARRQLIAAIPNGDWFIVLDSDYKIVKWENVKEKLSKTSVDGFRTNVSGNADIVRKTPKLRFRARNHRHLENKKGIIIPEMLEGIYIKHLRRSEKNRQKIEEYKKWLLKWENE